VISFPADGEAGVSFLEVNLLWITVPRQLSSEVVFRVEQPGIAGVGGEQGHGPDCHKATVVFRGTALDITDLLGEMAVLDRNLLRAWLLLDAFPAHSFAPIHVR